MIRRILVGLAGTKYTPVAIEHAIELARAQNAELTGVTVLDARRLRRDDGSMPKLKDHAEAIPNERLAITQSGIKKSIVDFETACQSATIKYRVVEESGDAFTKLEEQARYHDLIVFGLYSAFEYDFLVGDPESILIRLIGAGVRPLITVSTKHRSISRVLIAYSGSMESAKAMKRFAQMRLWPNAELKIMTFNSSEVRANELLRNAEDYCRVHGFRVCQQSNPGDPTVLLLAAAKLWQADMIVMGNSARTMLLRRVMGDTLLATMRNSEIPLFLAQ